MLATSPTPTPAELGEALAASWSAPLTPLSESRGYLVLACSTEQIHRSKRLIAQAIGQAAAVNRTFVEPGFAASFLVLRTACFPLVVFTQV